MLARDQFSMGIQPAKAQVRFRHSSTPINTVVMFVPQQEAWVVERMGKFNRILDPGVNALIPLLDKVIFGRREKLYEHTCLLCVVLFLLNHK